MTTSSHQNVSTESHTRYLPVYGSSLAASQTAGGFILVVDYMTPKSAGSFASATGSLVKESTGPATEFAIVYPIIHVGFHQVCPSIHIHGICVPLSHPLNTGGSSRNHHLDCLFMVLYTHHDGYWVYRS